MTPERLAEFRARYPSLAAVGELAAEIEHLWTAVTIFQGQRDGVRSSIWLPAQSLAGLAAFQLADNADDPAWNMANAIAHQLLQLAAASTGIDRSGEIQWGIRVHHSDPDGETSTSVLTGYTETGARHRAATEFEHAEPVYRHLGPWLDAPTLPDDPKDPA